MFYTEDRLKNWIDRIKAEEIDIESGKGIDVFENMLEDYVIAGINLIRSIRDREITKKDAIEMIESSSKVLESRYETGDELKDEFLELVIEQMKIIQMALKRVIEGKVSSKSFEKLLNEAIKKEKEGDMEGAFENIVMMAAKTLKGEKLPEEIEIPDEDLLVIGWFDAVDAINTINILSEIDKSEDVEED